MIKSL
jgi:hypothetical protein